MEILRKVLFYFFLALYLVLCPLVILYAFGYILTPKAEEGFVKTGLIHIESLPENASLSIASRRYVEKTPATIRNLLAGSYDVKLTLDGYRPWMRTARVEPGKASSFTRVLLIPQKLKVRTVIARSFDDLRPVPGTHFLLLKGSALAGDLWVYDWRNEILRPVLPGKAPFAGGKLERIFLAKESSWALIQIKTPGGRKFLGCPLDKDKPEAKDLSGLFQSGEPDDILWEGSRPDYLFALYDGSLMRLDLEKREVLPGFFKKVRGLGLSKGKVYALCGASILRSSFNARPGEKTLVEGGVFLENLFRGDEKFKLDFISNDTICFWGAKGELFSNALPYRFVSEGMRGYQADPDGRKIVLWQEKRLGVLDFERAERKKEFFERGPEIEWVSEKGKDIRQAYFVYESSQVLYLDEDQVFLSRPGESGVPPEKLVKVREGALVFYAEKTGKLYYLEPSGGHLSAVEILPEGIAFSGVLGGFEKETQGATK
jgi:hypothetical protein